MKTLPDYLATGLEIVSVGLNPSLRSVQAGFYFANPRNRFWRALERSGLAPGLPPPGPAALCALLHEHRIGFTDVVKRPTAGGAELRARDFRHWAPVLEEKLLHYRPAIVWFHGKVAYRNFLRYTRTEVMDVAWGEQPRGIGPSVVFVSPNPSPANAAFGLDEIIKWYAALSRLRRAAGSDRGSRDHSHGATNKA
ncbi:MAG: mismatch-specific DNA-glycosylase [Gammaproteobacteria bacterium]|nr:mismatch-specific DNA-glycosylase [Gammaproteobacteria bacterium]NIR83633.1 mismatch-specific DNA-glycosylase [Gammaproteobacteria bacterium]NIR91606.1 mismatch-specific DNA-glycosylase [Gammaproteobacteria bacterium]NIU04795.1 mismatch-specific DNA-glycosylase [Gammaproteobacteria bacterium]NIV53145.1 mismatch-specific DNA-glycosylase [Gammaproteobacteria bacterium]